MQTLVHFSNDGIQVLPGDHQERAANSSLIIKPCPLRFGALINGVITNEEVFRETIRAALKESPKLFKNINRSSTAVWILTKTVEVPKLKPRELETLAATEFDESAGNYDELVVDYNSIPGVAGNYILLRD